MFPLGTPSTHHVHPFPTGTLVLVRFTVSGAHPEVASAVKETTGNGFTVIVCVSVSPQLPGMVYVIVVVPTPATLGLNAPVFALIMPVPLHVPPGLAAVKVMGLASMHTDPRFAMVASNGPNTVMVIVPVSAHPEGVYETTSGPTPAVAGLKIPVDETPTPVHVPPEGVAFN